MTTLPERLLALPELWRTRAARKRECGLVEEALLDDIHASELDSALEAAQSLQAQEAVKETTINHPRDPHCCGCYVIRWNDGDPVAVCGECGVQVALLDRLVAPEGWVLVPREPTPEMVEGIAQALDYPSVFMGGPSKLSRRKAELAYAAMIYAAPSPSAALQAGVGRFVACRCVSERDRELCMTKDECSKVYAYSDTATKEPTK